MKVPQLRGEVGLKWMKRYQKRKGWKRSVSRKMGEMENRMITNMAPILATGLYSLFPSNVAVMDTIEQPAWSPTIWK
jgi:hypothetical protein